MRTIVFISMISMLLAQGANAMDDGLTVDIRTTPLFRCTYLISDDFLREYVSEVVQNQKKIKIDRDTARIILVFYKRTILNLHERNIDEGITFTQQKIQFLEQRLVHEKQKIKKDVFLQHVYTLQKGILLKIASAIDVFNSTNPHLAYMHGTSDPHQIASKNKALRYVRNLNSQ